jgi:hypothetical protein
MFQVLLSQSPLNNAIDSVGNTRPVIQMALNLLGYLLHIQ